jgi:phytoene synthase
MVQQPLSLDASYAYCHRLMRSAARNFYWGMRLLPPAKRQAMHALYTFMRLIDDIADDTTTDPAACTVEARRQRLEQWRATTHRAIAGDTAGHELWPAFHDTVSRFHIPTRLFDEAIDGQLQDLTQLTYATFDDLYRYCYRVASTVGIAAVHIWGFRDSQALKLAEDRGIAMQLTNILRDLREDAARGRRYVPDEDCHRFGRCNQLPISADHVPPGFDELMQFETVRAREYYERSAPLEDLVDADSRPTLRIMTGIYRGILDRIAANPRAVLVGRVSLTTTEKLWLVARHAWRAWRTPHTTRTPEAT